ncbi:MAG: hypothetical protein M1338_04280, partial [Patescibacteria group bacterium]|nr:hypothetical protein [Patescibacteria group bacterium]
ANIIFLAYDSNWFKALLKLVSGAISFWAIYMLYKILPFDFGNAAYNNLAKYFLFFCLIATAIGVTVEFFSLIFATNKKR